MGILFRFCFFSFFNNDFYLAQGLGTTRGRELESKTHGLCRYMWKITAIPRLKQVKIVLIGEVSWESVLRGKKLLRWNLHLTNRT